MKLRTIINILIFDSESRGFVRLKSSQEKGASRRPIPYNSAMRQNLTDERALWRSAGVVCLVLTGCVTELPATVESPNAGGALGVGRVVTVITGESERMYEPELRSFEFINLRTGERFRVNVKSDDQLFTLSLSPGEYELTRVQVNEGPFLSIAQLSVSFALEQGAITYLGTWRFGVESPQYGRMVVVSMIPDDKDRLQAAQSIRDKYPDREAQSIVTRLPDPTHSEARLYEVMPYPRYPTYFRRHVW